MRNYSIASRYTIALILAVVPISAIPVFASDELSLPGVVGDFQEDLLEGQLEFPGDEPSGETWLVVKGSLELGTYWTCETGQTTPWGSELHLYIGSWADDQVVASAHAVLPPVEGAFSVAVPLGFLTPDPGGSPFDLFSLSGTIPFEFYIGCDYGSDPVLCYIHNAGPVTIESSWLERRGSVPTETTSWDALKCMYR